MVTFGKYICLFSCLLLEKGDSCKPLIEGETYILRHVFKYALEEPLELVWLRNKVPISTCRRNMACYDYHADGTVTTIKSLGDGLFEAILTVKNVTKADEGSMSLKYLGLASLKSSQPLLNCTLQIYGHTCQCLRSDGVEIKQMTYRPIVLDRNSERIVNHEEEPTCRILDILTHNATMFILMILLFLIVLIYVLYKKENLRSKLYIFKRLNKGRKMRIPVKCLLLSPGDLKEHLVKPYSSFEKNPLSSVNLSLNEEFGSLHQKTILV